MIERKLRGWVTAVAVLAATTATAQVYNYEDGEGPVDPDSIRGVYVGLNLGAYFANANTAAIYNGYGYQRDGSLNNFANAWLNDAIQGNSEAIRRTGDALGGLSEGEWTFDESDMPGRMTYSPAFMWGGHLRYMLNADFGFFAEFNGSKPVTVGEFTIQRNTPSPDPTQSNRLERFQIRGEEQRLSVHLGLHRVLMRESFERKGMSTSLLPYFEIGGKVTFVKFEENIINLGDRIANPIVDLTVFYDRQNRFEDVANLLTGTGFGGFASVGGQIAIGSKFTINLGYTANFVQINLGEFSEVGLQHMAVFKAIYM